MTTALANPTGLGLCFENIDVPVLLRGTDATSAGAVGLTVCFTVLDVAEIATDGATSSIQDGVAGGALSNVTLSYTSTNPLSMYCGVIVTVGTPMSTAEPGEARIYQHMVRVAGVVSAYVQMPDNTSVGRGYGLILADGVTAGETAGYLQARGTMSTSTLSGRYVGIFLDTSLAGTTSDGALSTVLFNGLNGFGSCNDLVRSNT